MIEIAVAGVLLGLISSFHCVGMCGPLALSLPAQHSNKGWSVLCTYHAGRLLTYTSLGVIFGFAGRRFYLAGFQQGLSITLGVIVLLFAIPALFSIKTRLGAGINRFYAGLYPFMHRHLRAGTLAGSLVFGMLNGLLPCGMVYLAVAGALSTSGIWAGAEFMFFFGLGTAPALLALSLIGFRAGPSVRLTIRKMMPYVMGLMGVVLIIRGMNLGIPFLSPLMDSAVPTAVTCP